MAAKITVSDRISKNSKASEGGCINWTASRNKTGYGRINIDQKIKLAHRVAYELAHGDIPHGMAVCHHCDNPACVNVAHLFVATQYENMQDMARKGRASVTRGEKCGKAKLTEAQVLEILRSNEYGTTLARRYGVGHTIIYAIKSGKRWAHIPRSI